MIRNCGPWPKNESVERGRFGRSVQDLRVVAIGKAIEAWGLRVRQGEIDRVGAGACRAVAGRSHAGENASGPGDHIIATGGYLVFPDSQHAPSVGVIVCVNLRISSSVPLDLGSPVLLLSRRHATVILASMPEARIQEDDRLVLS